MMSAQLLAPALAALTYPAISAEIAAPCRLRDGQCAPVFLVLDIATDTDLACLPSRGTTFWLCTGRRFA